MSKKFTDKIRKKGHTLVTAAELIDSAFALLVCISNGNGKLNQTTLNNIDNWLDKAKEEGLV